jgi:hypothetical protein
MLLLALAMLGQSSIPSVAFHHTLADFLFGGELDQLSMTVKAEIDRILDGRGLNSYARPVDATVESDLLLTASYKDFDRPSDHLPENFVHIGPLRSSPQTARGMIERHFPERPLVVVGLSTSYMGQLSLSAARSRRKP